MSAANQSLPVALAMLRKEHEEILKLFGLYNHADCNVRRAKLLCLICLKIRLHFTVETGVLFPALDGLASSSALLDAAGADYANVIGAINELEHPGSIGGQIESRVRSLQAMLTRHIATAECAGGLFASAQHLDLDWDVIASRLANRRAELEPKFYA